MCFTRKYRIGKSTCFDFEVFELFEKFCYFCKVSFCKEANDPYYIAFVELEKKGSAGWSWQADRSLNTPVVISSAMPVKGMEK